MVSNKFHRPRHRHRYRRTAAGSFRLRMGKHASTFPAPGSGLHLLGHEWLRAFRTRHRLVASSIGLRSSRCWVSSPLRTPAAEPRILCAREPLAIATCTALGAGGGGIAACSRSASGVWYFYNAPCAERVPDSNDRRHIAAELRAAVQEVRVSAAAQGYRCRQHHQHLPGARSFDGTGRDSRCKTRPTIRFPRFISPIGMKRSRNVQFDRPFHLVSSAPRDLYSIYALDQPLAPGEVVTLTFVVAYHRMAFATATSTPQFAYNGTFFDHEFFPKIGYDRGL